SYPNKPVRIVAGEAGGSTDFTARQVAKCLTSGLGQQAVVDNRPGLIANETVAKSQPDGYTLLVISSSLWIAPLMQQTRYDPINDFSPVTLTNRQPNVLVVHPSLPVKTVRELVALAKSRPGELNYAAAGTGGSPHLAAEMFKSMAGVNIVRI